MAINKSWKANVSNLVPEYQHRLELLFDRLGTRYVVSSGWRSKVQQAALWALFKAGLGNPANPPGHSKHETGEATDINPTGGNGYSELHHIGYELGFHFPFAKRKTKPEPWHMELRPGRAPITEEQAMGIAIEPVGSASKPQGDGGWVWGARGHVYAFGAADHFGNWDETTRSRFIPCVALVPTASGGGYWLVSDRGETYAYGDAKGVGNYQAKWGPGKIIGAFRNATQSNGGVTLVRDDGQNLNLYALPA